MIVLIFYNKESFFRIFIPKIINNYWGIICYIHLVVLVTRKNIRFNYYKWKSSTDVQRKAL